MGVGKENSKCHKKGPL